MRAPSRHLLDESQRIQVSMQADPEAARGAALMALPSQADVEASQKLATAATIPVALGPMPGAPQSSTVSVNGAAQVEQTVRVDLNVTLDPAIRVQLDQLTNSNASFSVPLSAPTGTMDTDAASQRGGIGRM